MKTMRIRKWMVVGILTVVVFPWWAYFIVHLLNQGLVGPWSPEPSQSQEKTLNSTLNTILNGQADWHAPAWQSALRKRLDSLGVQAVIQDSSGAEIFHNNHKGHWSHPVCQMAVIENGRNLGTVSLFIKMPVDKIATISALVAIGIAIFIVSFQMQRNVMRPLEAMSRAARKIAGGDLEFELPATRVSEIRTTRTSRVRLVRIHKVGIYEAISSCGGIRFCRGYGTVSR